MKTRKHTDPASVSDTQPASVEASKSLILRVYDYIERMQRYGWILTRHLDGLDRYGYLEENGLFKEISFAQLVDFCNRKLSMSEVAACSDILPLGDELYGDYPPANQPAGVMNLESQNAEPSSGVLASAPSGDGPPEQSLAATAVTAPAPVAGTPPIPDVTGVSSQPQRGSSGTRKKRGAIPAQERLQGELF